MKKLVLILAVLLLPLSSWGWGREGHQIIAAVAEDHLDETTKVMIQSLIGNNHLYSVASWADDVRRQRPETAPWHYVDIPLGSVYDGSRDCAPPHSCVVVKIGDFVKVLTDKQASREDRAEALKFVVHFVGDIHQPLHAVGEARGGNSIPVLFLGSDQCGRYGCNLHGVWDSSMIEHAGMSRDEYVQHEEELIKSEKLDTLSERTVEQWANESTKLAQAAWVTEGTKLDERYYETEIKVADKQMALAGLRLAQLLNDTIGKLTPRDFASVPSSQIGAAPAPSSIGKTGSDVRVWVNTKSGVYHCPDTPYYGTTKQGIYMTESEALKKRYHGVGGRACSSPQ